MAKVPKGYMRYGAFEAASSSQGGLHDLAQPVNVPRRVRSTATPGVPQASGFVGAEENFYCTTLNQLYRVQNTLVDVTKIEVKAQTQVKVGKGDCEIPIYEAPPHDQEEGVKPEFDDFIAAMLSVLQAEGFSVEVTVGAYLSLVGALMPDARKRIHAATKDCDMVQKEQSHQSVIDYFAGWTAYQPYLAMAEALEKASASREHYHNKRAKARDIRVGDMCFLRVEKPPPGVSAKLAPTECLSGPVSAPSKSGKCFRSPPGTGRCRQHVNRVKLAPGGLSPRGVPPGGALPDQ